MAGKIRDVKKRLKKAQRNVYIPEIQKLIDNKKNGMKASNKKGMILIKGREWPIEPTKAQLEQMWKYKENRVTLLKQAEFLKVPYSLLVKVWAVKRIEYNQQKTRLVKQKMGVKIGRPAGSKFNSSMKQRALIYKLLNVPIRTMGTFLGVKHDTIYNAMKTDPEFKEKMENPKKHFASLVFDSLLDQAKGYEMDETKVFQYEGEIIKTNIKKQVQKSYKASELLMINLEKWTKDNTPSPADRDEEKIEFDVRKGLYEG